MKREPRETCVIYIRRRKKRKRISGKSNGEMPSTQRMMNLSIGVLRETLKILRTVWRK